MADILGKLATLINPEVMADMISAELPKKIKFAPLAQIDTTLVGQPGNTITVPSYEYIGDAADVGEGETIVSTELKTNTKQATVKKIGKSVQITDEAVLSGYGDPVGEITRQLPMSIAAKVDNDCLAAVKTATLVYDGSAAVLSYNGVVDALDVFGEEDYSEKVLFIHPKQLTQLRKDANFQDLNKYPIAGGVIMTGVIGSIAGCQVVVSKKVELNAGSTAYENYIVKPGALRINLKRDVEIEPARDAKKKLTEIVADEHYVAWLYDASKVVKATFKK